MTLAPYIRSRVTRKSQFLHRNHVRGALDFTGSERQSQYNFFLGALPWNAFLTVMFWEAFPSFLFVHLVKKLIFKAFLPRN